MSKLFRLYGASRRDPVVEELLNRTDSLTVVARKWFNRIRACGDDVLELMHDRYATACVADVPFAYVAVFKAHANIGFFYGVHLSDPAGLLEGSGKNMRHVKVRVGQEPDDAALAELIDSAYRDVKLRLRQ
jgi:hypothetical protein